MIKLSKKGLYTPSLPKIRITTLHSQVFPGPIICPVHCFGTCKVHSPWEADILLSLPYSNYEGVSASVWSVMNVSTLSFCWVLYLNSFSVRVGGKLDLIPGDFGREAKYTLDRSPIYRIANTDMNNLWHLSEVSSNPRLSLLASWTRPKKNLSQIFSGKNSFCGPSVRKFYGLLFHATSCSNIM